MPHLPGAPYQPSQQELRELGAIVGTECQEKLFIAVALHADLGSICRIGCASELSLEVQLNRSPVGCVSPSGARYASPQTGQISRKPGAARPGDSVSRFNPVGESHPRIGGGLSFFCVP